MVKIQRANTVLDIEDEDVERYVNLGYNVIDNKGNILREAIPNDVNVLQMAYIENRRKIEQLEKQIKELQVKLQDAKKISKKAQE